VTAVIRNDAPKADNINIFLLRVIPTSLKSCNGAATRETSAIMSAAGSTQNEDHSSQGEDRGTN